MWNDTTVLCQHFFSLANTTPCHVGFSCLSFVWGWKQCLPFLFWLASDVNKCWKMISGRCLFRCLFFVFVLNSGMITEKRSQNTTKTNQQLTRFLHLRFQKHFSFFLSLFFLQLHLEGHHLLLTFDLKDTPILLKYEFTYSVYAGFFYINGG